MTLKSKRGQRRHITASDCSTSMSRTPTQPSLGITENNSIRLYTPNTATYGLQPTANLLRMRNSSQLVTLLISNRSATNNASWFAAALDCVV
jgi:hypothetical protein